MNSHVHSRRIVATAFTVLLFSSGAYSNTIPSATPSGAPTSAPSSPVRIDQKEVREIRRKFIDILDHESEKLRAEQLRSRREGDAGRKARRKEWDTSETAARRKFFSENLHGPERRQYVHDLNERRKIFYEQLKNEERQQKNEYEAHWKALKEGQKDRLQRVEDCLHRLERPPNGLLVPTY